MNTSFWTKARNQTLISGNNPSKYWINRLERKTSKKEQVKVVLVKDDMDLPRRLSCNQVWPIKLDG